jgi:hypothetical protein
MSKTFLVIGDDGKVFTFTPDDWRWVVNQKDLEEGKYEPKVEERKVEGDKVAMRITQLIPPLAKIR